MPGKKEIRSRLLELSRNQYGVVTRRQLLAADFSGRQIDHYLERGALCHFFRATYSVGGPVQRWRAVWMAAVKAAGPGAMLSGGAAASLWGLSGFAPDVVDVVRGNGKNRIELASPGSGWKLQLRVRKWSGLPERSAWVDRIPVLPVPELLIERAAILPSKDLCSLVSSASQKKHLDEPTVARIIKLGQGRKGIKKLRHELRFWDREMRRALSVLETKFIQICLRYGIEVPQTNRFVCGLMVDFLWAELRVVVEVDGYEFHGDRIAFERDHDRGAILMRAGYLRLAFTWRQIAERPEEVVQAVIAALGSWRGGNGPVPGMGNA